jgi:hypothetical protein
MSLRGDLGFAEAVSQLGQADLRQKGHEPLRHEDTEKNL